MKRLCIYVTYDFENIIDDYIGYMLQEIRNKIDYLVVICNCQYIDKGIENIEQYADKMYYRDNLGFDAGAYKDALCKYIGWNEICMYDEVLLINDSFYGPIYPIENLFYSIANENIDYWGITRSPSGKLGNGYQYESHIQSYFMGFRKQVIQDSVFQEFWEKMIYPNTLDQAIASFEIGCNKLLLERGFRGTTLMDICQFKIPLMESDNPYIRFSLELIRDIKVPVFKRKSLILYNSGFGNALEALRYINTHSNYDIGLIWHHLMRINRMVNTPEFINYIKLEEFYNSHSKIYIYGAGMYGRNVAKYFDYKEWTFEGFLVTNTKGQTIDCKSVLDVDIAHEDGIIIAIGNKNVFMDILKVLEKFCSKKQIYNTDYDWK